MHKSWDKLPLPEGTCSLHPLAKNHLFRMVITASAAAPVVTMFSLHHFVGFLFLAMRRIPSFSSSPSSPSSSSPHRPFATHLYQLIFSNYQLVSINYLYPLSLSTLFIHLSASTPLYQPLAANMCLRRFISINLSLLTSLFKHCLSTGSFSAWQARHFLRV